MNSKEIKDTDRINFIEEKGFDVLDKGDHWKGRYWIVSTDGILFGSSWREVVDKAIKMWG